MRSLSRAWPPVTDRYARMRKRAATAAYPKAPAAPSFDFPGTVSPEDVARLQQAWDEIVGADSAGLNQIHHMPTQAKIQLRVSERRARSIHRDKRMRWHTYSLLIHALRSDGTMGSTICVQTCKAYRGLPWDIGFPHASLVTGTAPDGTTSAETVAEDVAADMGIVAAELSFLAPPGLEFVFDDAPEPIDLTAAPDILVELPEPPKDVWDALPHVISGSPAYERWREGIATPEEMRRDLGLDDPATAADLALRWGFTPPVTSSDYERLWGWCATPAGRAWLDNDRRLGQILDGIRGESSQPSSTDERDNPRPLSSTRKRRPWWHWSIGFTLLIALTEATAYLILHH